MSKSFGLSVISRDNGNPDSFPARSYKTEGKIMLSKWLFAVLLLLALPGDLVAQEPYLVAYAGFAGFQAPVLGARKISD